MHTHYKHPRKIKLIILPLLFYFIFLVSIFLLMKFSLLEPDYIFIRFHLLTAVLLGGFLWVGRDSRNAAVASVAGVVAPVLIMVCWFLLKAFVLFESIEWTEESFRWAISFSALLGVLCPLIFFNLENLKLRKQ